MDTTKLIGSGQQAKVFKGNYNDNDVAVKLISLYSSNPTDIANEIKVLRGINHENFIFLKGVFFLKKAHLFDNNIFSECKSFRFDHGVRRSFERHS